MDEERTLWERQVRGELIRCLVRSCCSGAELQVWRGDGPEPVLRELYPLKSDLYERARALEIELAGGPVVRPGAFGDTA